MNIALNIIGPLSPPLIALLFLVWTGIVVGGAWMLYVAVRHEDRPRRYGLLALVPFAFVWYYLARFRKLDIWGAVPSNAGNPRPSGRIFALAIVVYSSVVWVLMPEIVKQTSSAMDLTFFAPFVVQAVGQMWMAYTALRYERDPMLFFILSAFPLVFVWYYYFRVKAGKIESRREPKLNRP